MNTDEKQIYDSLSDDKSKKIFELRKQYKENGNANFCEIYDGVTYDFEHLKNYLIGKTYAIYGAGDGCNKLVKILEKFSLKDNCLAIYDSNSKIQGTTLGGIEITAFDGIESDLIIVSPTLCSKNNEICDYLTSQHISSCRIIKFCEYIAEDDINQYFDKIIVGENLSEKEVFVDGGCYDFNTSKMLISFCPNVKKIIAFEPNQKQISIINEVAKDIGFNALKVINGGLWSENTQLLFSSIGFDRAFQVSPNNNGENIAVYALDDVIESDDEITFIKMDIEGAELEALKGCEKTIRKYKPKLAISIYHKPNDYVEIPKYILSLEWNYKLYMRHYTNFENETVLYCV
ncbi:hypothetical protein AGMMS49938_05760 [Fibrobacterales bacterium]|nr:hypothetical protein AGMMS49938_05760 [Fibrobacterales bacterium]